MTKLNKGTQKAQQFAASYRYALSNHGERSVFHAYGRPSEAKGRAWRYCQDLCDKHRGKGLTVVGKTCHIFTAGFTFERGGKKYLCYITPSNDYEIELD